MRAWRANQLVRSLSNGWNCPTPSNLEMDNFAQFPFTNICKCKLCKIWIKKLTIVLIVSSHNDLVTLASDVLSADDSEQCGLFPCDRAGMPLIDHSFARDQITRPAVGRSMAAGRHGKYAFACWCRWDVGYWTQHYKCFGLLSFICSHWEIWGAEKFRRWFWQDKAKGGYFRRFFHCRPELAVLACRPAREPKAKASSQANDRLHGQHILPRFDMKHI